MSSTNSLTSWAQARLTALFESSSNTNERDFQVIFDSTLASGAEIFINHKSTTLDELKENIRSRSFAATRASLLWGDILEVPEAEDISKEGGVVAGSFTVTRTLKFRIRATPAQTNNQSVFSARIESVSAIQDGDKRRIVQLFLTSVDKAAPIHLHGVSDA